MIDITERKRAEEALARSLAEQKAVYDHSPVMMCVMDSDRRMLYANPAFTAFTGHAITGEREVKPGLEIMRSSAMNRALVIYR